MAKKKKEIIDAEIKEEKENTEEQQETKNENRNYNNNNRPQINITTMFIKGVLGLILLLLPEGSNKFIGYIVGGAFLLAGILSVLKYYKEETHKGSMELISGILYAILGLIVVLNPLTIMKLVMIILGVYLIVNGALKMVGGYYLKNTSSKNWKSLFIIGAIIVIFGVIIIIDPFSGIAITQIAGAFLLVSFLFDIIDEYILNK